MTVKLRLFLLLTGSLLIQLLVAIGDNVHRKSLISIVNQSMPSHVHQISK